MDKQTPSSIELQIHTERNNFVEKAKKYRERIHGKSHGTGEKKENNDDKIVIIIGILCIGIA